MSRRKLQLPDKPVQDFDVQAGGRGMSVSDVVSTYMKTPGHVLAVLRLSTNETTAGVAAKTGIAENVLDGYEKGHEEPTMRDLDLLAKHYKADMRFLLEAFGMVSSDASTESVGLAAQFGGRLTEHEKVDLKTLMESFSRRR